MIIEFQSSDRMFGLKAIGVYRKGIEAASAACEKIYAPTLELQEADAQADAAQTFVAERLDEMGVGEVRELDMPASLSLALRTACSVYITQLNKLVEKQADLLVPIEDTNVVVSHLTSLADRLRGQTELHGISTVTFAVPGHQPVTMSGDQLSRAAAHLSRQ